jgi:hypothetical protein
MESDKLQGGEVWEILQCYPSAALSVCAQADSVSASLAERIALANCRPGSTHLSRAEIIVLAQTDYRLIARALHIRSPSTNKSKCRQFSDSGPPSHFVNTLAELRNANDVLTVFICNHAFDDEVSAFLKQCSGFPGLFVEDQFDIPSRNAVFRNGVVKAWQLSFGTCVVSKRDNKRKKNRLLEEQTNVASILERLNASHEACVPLGHRTEDAYFTISHPICMIRDPATTFCYAISIRKPGETLEDILLDTNVPKRCRRQHLRNYRLCLDCLFDHGIVWRDMSPRNVLVEQSDSVVYHFVDFEKVEVWDGPLSLQSRIDACRSQFCVEEFGVIGLQEEMLDTFSGLFLPELWDLQSRASLQFPPRVEIAAVLAGRGVDRVSVGEFNRLDLEIQEVRCPRLDPTTGKLLRPGLLGFRVEHYLSLCDDIDSSDYDRKTTEILIAANAINRLIDSFHYLSNYINNLETAIILAEFDAILDTGSSRFIKYPAREALLLCEAIDGLYSLTRNPDALSSILSGCSSNNASS